MADRMNCSDSGAFRIGRVRPSIGLIAAHESLVGRLAHLFAWYDRWTGESYGLEYVEPNPRERLLVHLPQLQVLVE
jgi:hypothetical protein